MQRVSGALVWKTCVRSACLRPRCGHAVGRCLLISLAFPLVWVSLITPSVGQEAPHREFSANVLVRERGATSGYGARVYVKQDDLYLDLPDLGGGRHIPFWFLSDGTLDTVKEASIHEPSLEMPLVFVLHFRSTHADRFCEEFRAYYTEFEKFRDDLGEEDVKKLQHPQSFSCEPKGYEVVAERRCRTYRFVGIEEDVTNICFDPTLATIIEANSLSDLWIRLDRIEEKPQPQSLFIPPPDHIVMVKYRNWGQPAPH
jgi:hypothetical protein